MPGMNFRLLNLSPEIPLGRIGCTVDEKIDSRDFANTFNNTPFENITSIISNNFPMDSHTEKREFNDFVKEKFVDYVSIFRRFSQNQELEEDHPIVKKLIQYGVFNENIKSSYKLEDFGNVFECLVAFALQELTIQSFRETKIKYPIDGGSFDPDGQKYDVIGMLDFSNFIWVECKKPTYISENPLNNIISKENISKFIRRGNRLSPTIAVYLVDTKEDFQDRLGKVIRQIMGDSGLFSLKTSFDGLQNIMGLLNGNNYFIRVNYNSNRNYFKSLKKALQQVLYHSRFRRF